MCAVALWFASLPAHALSLATAHSILEKNNPELLQAAAEIRGREGEQRSAGLRPEAQLSFANGRYGAARGLGPGRWPDKRLESSLGVEWTLERGNKRQWRQREAGARLQAAQDGLHDVRRQLRSELEIRYFELKAAQASQQVADDNHRSAEEGLRATERRVQAGDLAPIERDRLAVEAMQIAEEAYAAERVLQDARSALAVLLGQPEHADRLTADDSWPDLQLPLETRVSADGLHERADLRVARADREAAEAALGHALSQRRRDIGVGFDVERTPEDLAGVSWGVSVTVPLGRPSRHEGERLRAEADLDQARLAYDQLQHQAQTGHRQAAEHLHAAQARRQRYEEHLAPTARRTLDAVESAYRQGAAGLTDLLDARRAWREVEHALIDARADHAQALAVWRAASTTVFATLPE